MTIEEFTIGARVRLNKTVDVFNLGSFPEGAQGTVMATEERQPSSTDPFAYVRLDAHFPALDEWDNQLQISALADECGEITEADLDLLPMPASEAQARALLTPWIVKFGLGFHPDTRGNDYTDGTKDARGDYTQCLAEQEAARCDADIEATFTLCDPYALSMTIWRELGLLDTTPETAARDGAQ